MRLDDGDMKVDNSAARSSGRTVRRGLRTSRRWCSRDTFSSSCAFMFPTRTSAKSRISSFNRHVPVDSRHFCTNARDLRDQVLQY